MRLGMFMMPVHPPARSFTETLAEDEEKALYADQLGFDELWLGEHFSASSEPIPSPLMFMASLLPRTKNLTFGTGVICLPNHDPVTVAAEVAQFDHMSRGRFMLGIGPGGLLSDFELFGNADRGVRARKTMESIALIQRIWAQDPPYDLPGEFRSVRLKDAIIPGLGIGFMPKPFQKSGPPVTMSVSSRNSPTARVAGQQGWGILSGNNMPANAVATHWQSYGKACAEAGRTARSENWRVSRNIMVAPSDAEAHDRVFSAQGSNRYFYTYMREVLSRVGILSVMKPDPNMPDEASHRRGHHRRLRALRLAENHARQARRLPRGSRPVRHAADDRSRLERTERSVGARFDAAPCPRSDAEIPPARDSASGGVAGAQRYRHRRLM